MVAVSRSVGVERGVAVGATVLLATVGDVLATGVGVGTNSATAFAVAVIDRVTVGETLVVITAVASGVAGRAVPVVWLGVTLFNAIAT